MKRKARGIVNGTGFKGSGAQRASARLIGIAAILSGWKNLSAVSGAAGDDSGGA